jgi:hypothetical protein
MDTLDLTKSFTWIEDLKLPYSLPIAEGSNCPDYPVVMNKKKHIIIFLYEKKNKCCASVSLALQDGFWVGGIYFMVGGGGCEGDGGRCFAPGRKWGEFRYKEHADLYYSYSLLRGLIHYGEHSSHHKKLISPCLEELIKHINSISFQLEFNL